MLLEYPVALGHPLSSCQQLSLSPAISCLFLAQLLAKNGKICWSKMCCLSVNCRLWPGTRLPPSLPLQKSQSLSSASDSIIQSIGSNMCVCHSISPKRCCQACLPSPSTYPGIFGLSLGFSVSIRVQCSALSWQIKFCFRFQLRYTAENVEPISFRYQYYIPAKTIIFWITVILSYTYIFN